MTKRIVLNEGDQYQIDCDLLLQLLRTAVQHGTGRAYVDLQDRNQVRQAITLVNEASIILYSVVQTCPNRRFAAIYYTKSLNLQEKLQLAKDCWAAHLKRNGLPAEEMEVVQECNLNHFFGEGNTYAR